MTDYSNYTNKYIENKIVLNLKTLNSFSIGEHKKYSDIYSLTGHEYRYSALSTVLKIMAIPLVAVSNVVKILSCEIVAVKEMVNIPLIMLKKMDQGIAKKILQGLDNTNEAELRDITNNILEQWKEDNALIPKEEDSVFTRFKNYVCENVPFIESIRNFWVNGGIHYSKTQLEEQHLVKKITKEIFKTAYIAGKEANSLTSDYIYNHFKEIGAYKDNMPTKEIDLVKYVEVETKAMSYEKVTEDTEVAIELGLGLDLDNSSDDVTVQAVITDENREQILDGIKQYLTSFANENPDLQENISQYLIDMNDYSNQELEKLILEFAEGQKVVKEMELHEAESVLAPYMSCGQEANQESIELEGIYDEVQSHEVLA